MLMKISGLMSVFAACFIMAACSTPNAVTTRDGMTTISSDTPKTDKDSDFVTYEKGGREVKVNKSDVRQIEEIK